MAKDDKDIVSELRKQVSGRVGKDRFELWFGSAVKFDVAGDLVTVAVADQFLLDRLRMHFRQDIESVVACLFSPRARLQFVLQDASTVEGERGLACGDSASPACRGETEEKWSGGREVASEESRAARSNTAFSRTPRAYANLRDYIVGAENRVAHAAAIAAVQRPGSMTPLFFYGPAGCGKTHLLEGICSELRRRGGVKHCVCLSAEQFTSHFLEALQGRGLPSFRRKHRDLDLLLIDDVQFFAGKRATIVELHHTIDALLRAGRQIVLAADRTAAQLSGISAELATRMAAGLICPIESATYETRLGIIQQISKRRGVALPEDVARLIAAEAGGDVRMLQGAVNRLQATSDALKSPITRSLAETALADIFCCTRRAIQLSDIDRVVCEVFGLEPKSLRGGGKTKAVSQPRSLAMWLARKYTRAAYSEIGDYFGRRSHSTVISAQKRVNLWMAGGASIRVTHGVCPIESAIQRMESQLRSG